MKACIIDSFCGCMLNSFDSQLFAKFFEANGYSIIDDSSDADVVLVNTCAFVKNVEDKVVDKIKELVAERKEGQRIIVTGCFPKINEGRLKEIFSGDYFGPREKEKINDILDAKVGIDEISINKVGKEYCNGAPSDRCYIKIADGCLGGCSFCSIKKAKGGLKSREVRVVVKEFKKGLSEGFKEFVLLGDDIGCYGKDIGSDISVLLRELVGFDCDYKIYLHFFEPKWFVEQFEGLLNVFKTGKIGFLNIPIQSGSDRILGLMNRQYKIDEVIDKVKILHREVPEVVIQTHILFGFPGETAEEFELSLAKAKEFDFAKFFCYSERPGTAALRLEGDVSEEEKKRRGEIVDKNAKEEGHNWVLTQ